MDPARARGTRSVALDSQYNLRSRTASINHPIEIDKSPGEQRAGSTDSPRNHQKMGIFLISGYAPTSSHSQSEIDSPPFYSRPAPSATSSASMLLTTEAP